MSNSIQTGALWTRERPEPPPPSPTVTVTMTRAKARELQTSIADLACWINGFKAAVPDDLSRHPMGQEAVRELNIALKQVLDE